MEAIKGNILTEKGIPIFSWIRNIQSFEIPLLSEYNDSNGNKYIFHWCDCSEQLHRYLAIKTDESLMESFVSGELSLIDLILGGEGIDREALLLDFNSEGDIEKAMSIYLNDIKDKYLPLPGTFFLEELS